jgi:urea transport system ATP-binding protein
VNLAIDGLDVAYGRTQVVFGVSLDVPSGSLTCLMGRNGVGKTTLLNTVMGLLPARSGSIRLDGEDITKAITYKRARMGIGYVPQGHQVFPGLTVRENLHVVHERARGRDPGAIDDAVDLFPALSMMMGRPAGLLSGGQAQQLAIARALVTRPQLLVLDEPTEGIQPSIIMQIEDAIAQLHASGVMTILLVEQYVEFALRLAERYAVMDAGRIEHSGDVASADRGMFASLVSI